MTSFFRNGNSPPKARDNSHPRTPEKSRHPPGRSHENRRKALPPWAAASLTPSKPGPTLLRGTAGFAVQFIHRLFPSRGVAPVNHLRSRSAESTDRFPEKVPATWSARLQVAATLHSIFHCAGGLLSNALPKGSST